MLPRTYAFSLFSSLFSFGSGGITGKMEMERAPSGVLKLAGNLKVNPFRFALLR
jgi:hypothetical protein